MLEIAPEDTSGKDVARRFSPRPTICRNSTALCVSRCVSHDEIPASHYSGGT
jgi:hypothetical protein